MSTQPMKPGWKMIKFGEVFKNANLVERDPHTYGILRCLINRKIIFLLNQK